MTSRCFTSWNQFYELTCPALLPKYSSVKLAKFHEYLARHLHYLHLSWMINRKWQGWLRGICPAGDGLGDAPFARCLCSASPGLLVSLSVWCLNPCMALSAACASALAPRFHFCVILSNLVHIHGVNCDPLGIISSFLIPSPIPVPSQSLSTRPALYLLSRPSHVLAISEPNLSQMEILFKHIYLSAWFSLFNSPLSLPGFSCSDLVCAPWIQSLACPSQQTPPRGSSLTHPRLSWE